MHKIHLNCNDSTLYRGEGEATYFSVTWLCTLFSDVAQQVTILIGPCRNRKGIKKKQRVKQWVWIEKKKKQLKKYYRSSNIRADRVHSPDRCLSGETGNFLPEKTREQTFVWTVKIMQIVYTEVLCSAYYRIYCQFCAYLLFIFLSLLDVSFINYVHCLVCATETS